MYQEPFLSYFAALTGIFKYSVLSFGYVKHERGRENVTEGSGQCYDPLPFTPMKGQSRGGPSGWGLDKGLTTAHCKRTSLL